MMRFFAITLLLFLKTLTSICQLKEVALSLSAKDKKSGFQLSPKYTVTSSKGTNIALKITNGETTALVLVGETYKITAELEGYFTKEVSQSITENDYPDGRGKVIEMDPQPSAMVSFVVTDAETNDPIEATIKLTSKSKNYSGKTLKENPTYKFIIIQQDTYQIEISAVGYATQKSTQNIEIGDPPRQITKPVAMNKLGSGIKILIVGEDTNKPLKGAKLTVTNTTDKLTLIDNILPDAEAQIEVNSNKKYAASVEADGYVSKKIDLNPNGNQTIKLQPTTYFGISVYDNLLNKRIVANVKVKLKGQVIAQLKSDAAGEIKFTPKEKGKYEFEASMSGFRNGYYETELNNMSSGRVPVRINQESAFDAYVIIVQDEEDKQLIQNAKVVFMGQDGVLVPPKYNQKTGEWKFELEKDKEYKLSISAPNYVSIEETFIRPLSKLISKNLKKQTQSISYRAIDSYTRKPINVNYKLIKPDQSTITGTSDATKAFTINILPQNTYIIEATSAGYKTFSENITFIENQKSEKVIELSKDAYSLTLKVIDSESKKPLNTAKILVINQSNSQPLAAKSNSNGVFVGEFNPNNTFLVEFEAEDYLKNSQKINVAEILKSGKNEVELLISKSPINKYRLTAVSEVDGKKVLNADLRIFNNQNQIVPVVLNPSEMEWMAELKNDETYSVEVKAPNFLAYKNILQFEKGLITIKLKPLPKQELILTVNDVLTQKPVVAEYKITGANETLPSGVVTNGVAKLNMTLLQDKNYELEVTASGYKPHKETIKVNRDGKNDFKIELKKEFYSFTIKAIDSKNKKPIGKVNVKIINDKDKQPVIAKNDPSTNEFSVNLPTDNSFTAEFEANGYKSNSIKLDVNELAQRIDFKKDIPLEAIIIEKKEEPKKEEPKNVDVKITTPNEPKKEEPKVEETKKEIIKPKPTPTPVAKKEEKRFVDDAEIIEETELSVKVEVYENLVVGKRYRLGSVNFEQGTAILKPNSNIQLDKLIRTLKLNPKYKIEITGHTDNVGDVRLNQILSEQRATKIGNYLFNGGIAQHRITTIGKGQEEPIAPNDTETNKAKNRRVEFVLKDK